MKYIVKTDEPEVLAKFKAQENEEWQPKYDKFRGAEKREFHSHLITEQGHICCYCGQRIQEDDSHIEHFRPQTEHRDLELDYFNLLTSCQKQLEPKDPKHCGMGKGHWFDDRLLVSPLISDCADFFEYTLDGQILPSRQSEKAESAKETIDRMSLNIRKLQAAREGAIASLDLLELTIDEIDKLIYSYDRTDHDGKYSSYCQAIVYVLKQEKFYLQA